MENERINELLDKYGACATSVEEEGELRRFFASAEKIPPELRPYQAWFRSPEAETLSPLGPDFDRQVWAAIRRQEQSRYQRYRQIGLWAVLIFFLLGMVLWGIDFCGLLPG